MMKKSDVMLAILKSNIMRFDRNSDINDGIYYMIKACDFPGIELYTEEKYNIIADALKNINTTGDDRRGRNLVRWVLSSCVVVEIENGNLLLPPVFVDFIGGDGKYDLIVADDYIKITRLNETNDGSKSIMCFI